MSRWIRPIPWDSASAPTRRVDVRIAQADSESLLRRPTEHRPPHDQGDDQNDGGFANPEHVDYQLYLVMVRYDGETLKERIARGPVVPDDAIDTARSLRKDAEPARHVVFTLSFSPTSRRSGDWPVVIDRSITTDQNGHLSPGFRGFTKQRSGVARVVRRDSGVHMRRSS